MSESFTLVEWWTAVFVHWHIFLFQKWKPKVAFKKLGYAYFEGCRKCMNLFWIHLGEVSLNGMEYISLCLATRHGDGVLRRRESVNAFHCGNFTHLLEKGMRKRIKRSVGKESASLPVPRPQSLTFRLPFLLSKNTSLCFGGKRFLQALRNAEAFF